MNLINDFFGGDFPHRLQSSLGPAVGPALVAFGAAALLTPVASWLAHRTGFLSHPRARDVHARPTPYLGGVALYLAFAIAGLVFLSHERHLPGLLILGGITTALFVIDDRFGMPAWIKLGSQAAIAVAAVELFSFGIDFVYLPGIGDVHLGLLVLPVTLLWILGMQNTVNLLDGLDGLAAGVVAITAVVLMLAATRFLPAQAHVVALSAVLAGACGGFLLFNFNPARIFMGDSGAHFLGLMLALLSVLAVAKGAVIAAIAMPVLAMGLPIADTAIAIVRRRRQGLSVAHADTRHLHHRLLWFGFNQREICVLFYGFSAILGAAGLAIFGHKKILAVAIVTVAAVMVIVIVRHLRTAKRGMPLAEVFSLFSNGQAPLPQGSEEEKGRAIL